MGHPSISPLFLATTVTTGLNTVYFKRMMNCYRSEPGLGEPHDYAVFVSVFDILLWALLMSALARAGRGRSGAAPFGRRGLMRAAVADQLCTLLATIGATQVPGQAQVLLNQAVLPLTMLMSLALGRRYSMAEALGAAMVLAGATAAAGLAPLPPLGQEEALRTGVIVFSLAQMAGAGAGLVKEALLQEARVCAGARDGGGHRGGLEVDEEDEPMADPLALGVAIAWMRVPLGILLALALRRGDGTAFMEFYDGWRCFRGERPRPGDSGCSAAGRTTLLSVALYAAQTLLGLRLTQRGSATFRSIAAVTAVPLAQFLFTSELLMTDAGAEAYNRGSALGLALCLAGFSVYLRGRQRNALVPPSLKAAARLCACAPTPKELGDGQSDLFKGA